MTKLERTFVKIEKQLRKRYSFLADVSIDVNEGYGIAGATRYHPASQSINIDLNALRECYNTKRFVKRLGKHKTFEDFVLVILLHEICHAKQHQTIPEHRLNAALNQIGPFDVASHDESWVEKEADKWARREFSKGKTRRSKNSI